jgi:hypothetical protein
MHLGITPLLYLSALGHLDSITLYSLTALGAESEGRRVQRKCQDLPKASGAKLFFLSFYYQVPLNIFHLSTLFFKNINGQWFLQNLQETSIAKTHLVFSKL